MTPLDDLIAAVEAGVEPVELWLALGSQRNIDRAQEAYRGSLDAALRLHEALLPGWDYCIDDVQRTKPLVYVQDDGGPTFDGEAANPARAWLLAILRALKAKGVENE